MLTLTEKGVEVFNKKFNSDSQEAYWENYSLLIWKKNPSGYTSIDGLFRKSKWGIVKKFPINKEGLWILPYKYVKYFK